MTIPVSVEFQPHVCCSFSPTAWVIVANGHSTGVRLTYVCIERISAQRVFCLRRISIMSQFDRLQQHHLSSRGTRNIMSVRKQERLIPLTWFPETSGHVSHENITRGEILFIWLNSRSSRVKLVRLARGKISLICLLQSPRPSLVSLLHRYRDILTLPDASCVSGYLP